jgi:hypothetical protein
VSVVNRQFRLAARPIGWVKESDFRYAEEALRDPGSGEVRVRTTHLSLDPSMRGQMENRADYVAPLELGDVMRAGGVGVVEASNDPGLPEGALVGGTLGMQTHPVLAARLLRRFPDRTDPVAALSVFGGTGMTAYFGLLEIGRPRSGETVVVSGAAGATGSIAGQIARLKGARVIGIAGGREKCRWLTGELGFDGAIDYKSDDVGAALDRLCPKGIDVYFDNVGGEILDLCLDRIAMNARVVLCGGISRYNATGPLPGPKNYFNLVFRRARMEGFIVLDYAKRFEDAMREMQIWIDAGRVRYRATIVEGFEQLPRALIRLFEGGNVGKMMVRVGE